MNNLVDSALTSEQARQYERDGITYPLRIMSAVEAKRFRTEFERLETYLERNLEYVAMAHLYFRWAYDLATWPRILDAVEKILGPDILIEGTLILCKHAGDPSFVMWHQDFHYASAGTSPTASAWVAISNSTCRSGCMRVIPDSHNHGVLPHDDTAIKNSMLKYSLKIDESLAIDIQLKAGEMSLHRADIIHGSSSNQTQDKRIGFIVRFVTPEFKNALNPVVRARGTKTFQHLILWEPPSEQNFADHVSDWKSFVQERNIWR
jgi:non-haem Fe2+, alpha-ketoglutarate-dependent halogenase